MVPQCGLGWCLFGLGIATLVGVVYLILKPQKQDWEVAVGFAMGFKRALIVLGTVLGAFFVYLSFRIV